MLLELAAAIEASPLGTFVRETPLLVTFINALHILGVAVVFGTIFVVDLRLLGFPDALRSMRRIAKDVLPYTWIGFGLALVTGLLMFSSNATTFYSNTQFWLKMAAIGLAGVNMLVFELFTMRTVDGWDTGRRAPGAARAAGLLSLLFWTSAIFLGRWIGYTKGFDFAASGIDLDTLDFL